MTRHDRGSEILSTANNVTAFAHPPNSAMESATTWCPANMTQTEPSTRLRNRTELACAHQTLRRGRRSVTFPQLGD